MDLGVLGNSTWSRGAVHAGAMYQAQDGVFCWGERYLLSKFTFELIVRYRIAAIRRCYTAVWRGHSGSLQEEGSEITN